MIDQDPRCDRRPGQSDPIVADPRPGARGSDGLVTHLSTGAVIADKAYDADDRVVQPLEQAGIEVVIPPRSQRRTPLIGLCHKKG